MNIIRKVFNAHWGIFFFTGVLALALLALQLISFSIGSQGEREGLFSYFQAHIAQADSGGDDGGGDSGGGGGDDGSGSGGDDGGCCGGGGGGGDDGGGG